MTHELKFYGESDGSFTAHCEACDVDVICPKGSSPEKLQDTSDKHVDVMARAAGEDDDAVS